MFCFKYNVQVLGFLDMYIITVCLTINKLYSHVIQEGFLCYRQQLNKTISAGSHIQFKYEKKNDNIVLKVFITLTSHFTLPFSSD